MWNGGSTIVKASIFGAQKDIFYMTQALEQAQIAASQQEVPVGAVVVNSQGDIVAKAHNATVALCSQAAHAEMQALREAGLYTGDWRLNGHWLYVTLEPCIMCMGLIYLSRIDGLVYGAMSPLFGPRLDKSILLSVYKVDTLCSISGVCASESAQLLKQFFKEKRNR